LLTKASSLRAKKQSPEKYSKGKDYFNQLNQQNNKCQSSEWI
jgi:hypothetical protein